LLFRPPAFVPLGSPLLQARGLAFAHGSHPVLRAINLDLPAGSRTVIQGDNGAGKSTLLRLLQGQLQPTGGWVRLQGRPLKGQRRRLALVPQSSALRWHFPIDLTGLAALGAGGDRRRGLAALRQVNLEALASQPIARLSGGQRQRALIARALAQNAAVLLLDEPLASLDAPSRERLGALLQRLAEAGTAVLLTVHGALPDTLGPVRRHVLHDGLLRPDPLFS
jgi:ABC-type Mn2+/Zn2+ transport system ATPase subunit